ncbi:MAG TPA: hypothetical protein DDW52_04380 [Planctomycetaceae bacterium]|nr:hypothetical protein [Planctomycetaceae bacterium]
MIDRPDYVIIYVRLLQKCSMILLVFSAIGFLQLVSAVGLIALAIAAPIWQTREESLANLANALAVIIACTSAAVLSAYLAEYLIAFFSKNPYEYQAVHFRQTGDSAYYYWIPLVTAGFLPQLFWFERIRRSMVFTLPISAMLVVAVITVNPTTRLRRSSVAYLSEYQANARDDLEATCVFAVYPRSVGPNTVIFEAPDEYIDKIRLRLSEAGLALVDVHTAANGDSTKR